MASFLGNKQTSESYKTVAVPQSLQSNDSPMALRSKVTQVSIPSINGDQNSNGKLRFVLPNNNVSISRRSMFIRARCSVSFTATLPTLNGNTSTGIWFQGPGASVTGNSSYALFGNLNTATANDLTFSYLAPILSNAYSLIQRSTIYAGSTVVDMIDYVSDLMSGLILPHATSQNWITNDGRALLAICSPPMKSTTLTTGGFVYWDLCIPVIHSCFNTEHNFPNYLLSDSNPLSLEVDLTTFARAIAYGSTVQSTPPIQDFTLSRIALCYEAVQLPREFIEAQRLATKNIPFVIPQLSYMIYQMPISALVNYNVNLKLSSLRAAYILPYNNSTYTPIYPATAASFAYQRLAADVAVSSNSGIYDGTNAQLFIDGRCVNQVNLDNPTMTYVALKQALKGSITDLSTSSSFGSLPQYKASFFAIGIDTTCFSDEATIMGGTPVETAQFVLTNMISNATTGTYLANIIFSYDSLLIIRDSVCEVRR